MSSNTYIDKRLDRILRVMEAVKEEIAELKTDLKEGRTRNTVSTVGWVPKKDRPGLSVDDLNWNRAAELDREDWMQGKGVEKKSNSYHEIDELTDRDRPVDLANREVEDDGFITLDDDLTHRHTDN